MYVLCCAVLHCVELASGFVQSRGGMTFGAERVGERPIVIIYIIGPGPRPVLVPPCTCLLQLS